jgi:hypothetical protein
MTATGDFTFQPATVDRSEFVRVSDCFSIGDTHEFTAEGEWYPASDDKWQKTSPMVLPTADWKRERLYEFPGLIKSKLLNKLIVL